MKTKEISGRKQFLVSNSDDYYDDGEECAICSGIGTVLIKKDGKLIATRCVKCESSDDEDLNTCS